MKSAHSKTYRILCCALACALLAMLASCQRSLPDLDDAHRDLRSETLAFPGAQGFAAAAVGGRGGQVVRVTTLAADGEGSLRHALELEGPRTIVFEVGGVIDLPENLVIANPFVTIAGQTAPSPGITLIGGGLEITAHEVIVRHLRIRPGDREAGAKPENRDAIAILGDPRGDREVYNVLVDHCTLSWGVDETFSTWYEGVRDVTLSNSLIYESLDDSIHPQGPHSKALLIGDHTRRFSMIGNVLAHNDDRNPILKGDASGLMVNNFIYDPGRWPLTFFDRERRGPSLFTAVGNTFIAGKSTPPEHLTILIGRNMKSGTQIYLRDNIGLHGTTEDPWDMVDNKSRRAKDARVDEPPVWLEGLEPMPASALEEHLLPRAGARPLDRDTHDARVIRQIMERTGHIIDSHSEVGGFPAVEPATRAEWELPEDASLEEWLEQMHRALVP